MEKVAKVAGTTAVVVFIILVVAIISATVKEYKNKQEFVAGNVVTSTLPNEGEQLVEAVKQAGSIENFCMSGLNFSKEKGLTLGKIYIGTCEDFITICSPQIETPPVEATTTETIVE